VTASFEFLIGSAPVMVALILAVTAFDTGKLGPLTIRRGVVLLGAFVAAFVLMFLWKSLAVALAWGPAELSASGAKLLDYARIDNWQIGSENAERLTAYGVTVEQIRQNRFTSVLFAIAKMVYFMPQLAFGSLVLGAFIALGVPLLAAALSIALLVRSDSDRRIRGLLFLAALGSIFLWHVIFTSHTIIHASFMVRTLGWAGTISLGIIVWIALSGKRWGQALGAEVETAGDVPNARVAR
jgi:hypothetical protein